MTQLFVDLATIDSNFDIIHHGKPNQSDHMDLEFYYKREYIRAEAKCRDDNRNNSQNALSLFGSLMKGFNLAFADQNASNTTVKYAAMLYRPYLNKYKDIFKTIEISDWNLFGNTFNVKYIFIISHTDIQVVDWEDFPL